MSEYRKAIVSGVFAALAFLAPVVDDGVTAGEILSALVAGGIGAGVTWAVPNKAKRA